MRSDYVETLIVGSDYISTITGLLCFEKKSSVALLNEHNFYQDPAFLSHLNSFDFHYLNVLGEKHNIQTLRNLKNYIINSPFTFHTNDKSIVLGRDFSSNIHECLRKIPEIFNSEQLRQIDLITLSQQHEKYLGELARKLHQLSDISKFREAVLIDDYHHFKNLKSIIQWDDSVDNLLRCLAGAYDNYIPKKMGVLHKLSLIFNLFSPFYLLDNDRLNNDLIREFEEKGGQVLSDKIEGFTTQGKKLEGVKLEQTGRTFHFEELVGIGHPRDDLQLKVDCQAQAYMSVNFVFDKIMCFPKTLGRFDYVVKQRWLGSSIQSLSIQQFSDRVIASFSISPELQSKLQSSFIDYLQKELENFIRELGYKGKYTTAPYIYNDFDWRFREMSPRSMKKALSDNSTINYIWWGDQKQGFSNSRYIGQFSMNPLGKTSLFHKAEKII